jgi:hypothetical protein
MENNTASGLPLMATPMKKLMIFVKRWCKRIPTSLKCRLLADFLCSRDVNKTSGNLILAISPLLTILL